MIPALGSPTDLPTSRGRTPRPSGSRKDIVLIFTPNAFSSGTHIREFAAAFQTKNTRLSYASKSIEKFVTAYEDAEREQLNKDDRF